LQETVIKDVMTKIEDVFWLSNHSKLTFDVLTQIFKSGHSRIPIMKKSQFNNHLTIVGMLFAKDLILLDPEDEISVQHVMNAFKSKKPLFLSEDTKLDQCLKIFVHSRQHLCMVKSKDLKEEKEEINTSNDEQFNQYLYDQNKEEMNHHINISIDNAIGIITLEDVIEHALQTELVDEHDVFININSHQQTNRLERIDWSVLKLFDHRHKPYSSLPPQELQAVFHFLSQSCKPFLPKHRKCTESSIKNLLNISSVIKVECHSVCPSTKRHSQSGHKLMRDPYKSIENNGLLLAERDKKTDYFTLILDGKCEVYAGRQGFRSNISRWTFLCPEALEHVEECVMSGKPMLDYVPDFTCKVIEDTRVLRVKLSDFKACIEGKFESFQSAQPKEENIKITSSSSSSTEQPDYDTDASKNKNAQFRYTNMASPKLDKQYKKQ